ncbi:MAG: hypothetical protein H6728_15250 [Myxococcales bacterium]|nr:hypothetical protein [Myxococcales bacterium]MCB9644427.1 hypothetical protein [Myxococcales bacterium]
MTPAMTMEIEQVALELHKVLRDMDPAQWRDDLEATLRDRMARLSERMTQLQAKLSQWKDAAGQRAEIEALSQRWNSLQELIREHMPRVGLSNMEIKQEWASFRKQMLGAYEDLIGGLGRFSIHVPHLRPTNYMRNLYHVGNGLMILALIEFILSPRSMIWVAGGFCVFVWTLEITRRIWPRFNDFLMEKVFHKVAHPHEAVHVNSATWYVNALFLLSLTCPPAICAMAVVVLGFADPAAAIIGRRFGRHRLVNGRSLEGSFTFWVVGAIAALVTLQIFHPTIGFGSALLMSLGAALAGALAELFSQRIDDNLSIPLASAAGASLVAMVLSWLMGA